MLQYCLCFIYCQLLSVYVYYIKLLFGEIYSLIKLDILYFTKMKIIVVFNKIGNVFKSALRYKLIIDRRVINVNIDIIIIIQLQCRVLKGVYNLFRARAILGIRP